MRSPHSAALSVALTVLTSLGMLAQQGPPGGGGPEGPGGFGGPGGPGMGPGARPGGGPPSRQKTLLVKKHDRDGDGILNSQERLEAREAAKKVANSNGPGRRGGPRGGQRSAAEIQPSPKVSPQDVSSGGNASLYDDSVIRTLFLNFEAKDWEQELTDFHDTDVDVPAELMVDGRRYSDVGVHFRGMSSYFMVSAGQKRSLNLSIDHAKKDQNLLGYRTLNLLNSHEDPSFLRTVLYSRIAREYLPAPKANLVHVVINGESWGIYSSQQQFNKEFTRENFGSTKGTRWKVSGSPNGRGTLAYLGDKAESYRGIYDIKTKDSPESWKKLIETIRVLNQTPSSRLKAELEPLLDVDGALRFLAVENALVNNDGYWIRTSDYALYLDESGRMHVVPHDMNEGFTRPGGPGFGGGPMGMGRGRGGPGGPGEGGGRPSGPPPFGVAPGNPGDQSGRQDGPPRGFNGPPPGAGFGEGRNGPGGRSVGIQDLDPLFSANDSSKPLIQKLLVVPEYRERYLGYVRDIAEKWLDWERIGPIANRLHSAILPIVRTDTRKLDSFEEFESSLGLTKSASKGEKGFGQPTLSLQSFVQERRSYLLSKIPEPKGK